MLQILIIFSSLLNYRAPAGNKIDPRCFEKEYVRAWVFFTDKGITTDRYNEVLRDIEKKINPNSLMRRKLRNGIIDYSDIPLREEYIEEIEKLGAIVLYRSRWLNGASFMISRNDLENIARLAFVHKIIPVAHFTSNLIENETALQETTNIYTARQLQMFNIDSLHKIGVYGSNIRVGFLDTGLRRTHIALDSVKVIAEYDFLGGDQVLLDNIAVTPRHGVYTEMLYHARSDRHELFLVGDTSYVYMPARDILWTHSLDNGNTWTELRKLTNNSNNNWITEIDLCGQDTTFLFFRNRTGLNFLVLDTTIITGPITIIGGPYENPKAVKYNDTVYFFYRDRNNIFLRKGNISGFPDQILAVSSTTNIKLSTTFSGQSKLGIFYYTFPDDSLFFAWSTIPSDTFHSKFTGFVGKDPKVVCSGDTIFALFKDASNSPFFRIAFFRSDDFGNNFNSPVYLSDNLNSAGKISICRQANTITTAWESNGKIYFRISYDNGESFAPIDSMIKEFVYLPTLSVISSEVRKFYCQRGDNNTDGYNP
ncbi:MAG: hypothetical protein ABIL20_06690, partial [candidate division WOR-3 bacterium]